MDVARLSRLTQHEKASLRAALEHIIEAARLDPAHPAAQRIFALKQIIAMLEEPGHPGDFDELLVMLEAVIPAIPHSPLRARVLH
jgi:hypothetical protein